MVQPAIQCYHDLLDDQLAADCQAQLEAQQKARGLYFGDRMVCNVLRPRFLSHSQYRFLEARTRALCRAFRRVHQLAEEDPLFRQQFGLSEAEEVLFQKQPGFPCPYPTSRLDAFFVSEQELRFTEYNTETPAGAAYGDALSEVMLTLPVMVEFSKHYAVRPVPVKHTILQVLLDAYRQWRGTSDRPRIAILDWREVPTYSEFLLFYDYFRSQGLDCVIADPREMEYRDGTLWAGDFAVTLIYKRVLISELLERGGLQHPVVQAVCDGAVCMVNSFRCKPLFKKASFAVLTDERNAHLFDQEERQAIHDHLPWTRTVAERRTEYQGQSIDLVPFILQNRERLVLKPNDEYGGKGVVLGWTVDAGAWEQAVLAALKEPYVVQERVALPREPFPRYQDGQVRFLDCLLDTDPYVSHGQWMDGCMTRISTGDLLNVTAGAGSAVPTFLVEPR
jgi:hypothetical protein